MIQHQQDSFTIFQSLIYKTTSTVIQTEDCIIVVDPNLLPSEVEEIRAFVNSIKGERPIYVIYTHSDWDHIIGSGAFLDSTTIASERFVMREDQAEIVHQAIRFDDQYYLERNYSIMYPNVDIQINEDGQVLEIGNTRLTFYHAHGHTDDGIFIVIEPLGIWIAGDYFSDIEFPFIYDDSTKYEETLNKMDMIFLKHTIDYLIPGHGHITNIKEEMKFRKIMAQTYIKELRDSIKNNRGNEKLLRGYKYQTEFKLTHEANILQLKKELEASAQPIENPEQVPTVDD